MRLKVQAPQPGPASDPPATAAGSEARTASPPPTVSPDSRPASALGRSERILATVTNWTVALPVALLSVALLGWALLLRLPDPHRALSARARSLPQRPSEVLPATPEALAKLRQQVQRISGELCEKPDELGPLLSRLETGARQLGWQVEASIQPAVAQPGGLKELTLHPVVFQLADTGERAEPAYTRLMDWLRLVSSLHRRIEVASLQLHSAGSGLRKAQIELHLLSLTFREETSPK